MVLLLSKSNLFKTYNKTQVDIIVIKSSLVTFAGGLITHHLGSLIQGIFPRP